MNTGIIFPNGKYRFMDVCRIPADYLIKVYKQFKKLRPDIYHFVVDNREALNQLGQNTLSSTEEPLFECNKIRYLTKKAANIALEIISTTEQEHIKPTRVYECDKCSHWHLTSMPLEYFKKLNEQ